MAHLYMKPEAPSRREDYHISYRALLRERLSLDTEECLKLGTDAPLVISPKRKRDSSVESAPKRRALNGSSDRPKKAQDPRNQKSLEMHIPSFAMQRCRNMLKGNKCTNLNKYRFKKASCGGTPCMTHFIKEEPPQKPPTEDMTGQPNFGSVSNDMTYKPSSQVLQPCGGHQSGSSHFTPEPSTAYPCNNLSMGYNYQQRCPQRSQPYGEHQRHPARPLIQSSRLTPEVSTPVPYWRRREMEQMKREAQLERQQAACLTKMGLDRNPFISRVDYELHRHFKELDRIYYSFQER